MVMPVSLAVAALGHHPLRSALALVGITIGVAAVILVAAVGAGARQSIQQHVQAAGANMILVSSGNYSRGDQDPSSGDVAEGSNFGNLAGGATSSLAPVARPSRRRPEAAGETWAGMSVSPRLPGRGAAMTLTVGDVDAIGALAGVRFVAATVTDTAVVSTPTARLFARLQGTDVEYAAMRALTVRRGRFVNAGHVERRAAVAALSSGAAARLFGTGVDPVGRTIHVRRQPFGVVGIVDRPGGFAGPGTALDEIFVPYTAMQDLLNISHVHGAAIAAVRAGESTDVARSLTLLLRGRHGLGAHDADDFTVRTQAREAILGKGVNPLLARAVAGSVVNLDQVTLAEMAESLERSSHTMTALLTSVAATALVVGGIGVMNVMLVSVTERTREIGLRMAVGARARDVMAQLLAEAIALSLIGGLIGVAIGVSASGAVGRLLRWSTAVSPLSVAIAVVAAAASGVFFGFYPARQAARLDPIDAMRYE